MQDLKLERLFFKGLVEGQVNLRRFLTELYYPVY
jgi:hypothetical protein